VMAMIPSSGPNSKAGKRFRSNHIRFRRDNPALLW